MDNPESEITQVIDLAALREEAAARQKQIRLDLYEVLAESMAGDTHPGLVRKHNEDCFACCTKPDGHLSFAVVADGVGGSDDGEIASSACIAFLIQAWRKFSSTYTDTTWENAQEFLVHAIMDANETVYKIALEKDTLMGTTLAAILFADRYVLVANAGDSRVYRLRNHTLEQLSTDHTAIAEALARGEISEQEAADSPYRHTITRAIGAGEFIVPQICVTDHLPGDCFLICSDGLTSHLSDEEIAFEMDSCYDPVQCVDHLMKQTLKKGAFDNLTIISVFA